MPPDYFGFCMLLLDSAFWPRSESMRLKRDLSTSAGELPCGIIAGIKIQVSAWWWWWWNARTYRWNVVVVVVVVVIISHQRGHGRSVVFWELVPVVLQDVVELQFLALPSRTFDGLLQDGFEESAEAWLLDAKDLVLAFLNNNFFEEQLLVLHVPNLQALVCIRRHTGAFIRVRTAERTQHGWNSAAEKMPGGKQRQTPNAKRQASHRQCTGRMMLTVVAVVHAMHGSTGRADRQASPEQSSCLHPCRSTFVALAPPHRLRHTSCRPGLPQTNLDARQ